MYIIRLYLCIIVLDFLFCKLKKTEKSVVGNLNLILNMYNNQTQKQKYYKNSKYNCKNCKYICKKYIYYKYVDFYYITFVVFYNIIFYCWTYIKKMKSSKKIPSFKRLQSPSE